MARTGIRTTASDLSAPITVSLHLNMVPGAKMVQMTDRATGETVKGIFLPFQDDNGIVAKRGKPLWRLSLIPFPDGIATHVVLPHFMNEADEAKFKARGSYRKTSAGNIVHVNKFGNGYVHGRVFCSDLRALDDIREKHGKKRLYTEHGGGDSMSGGQRDA